MYWISPFPAEPQDLPAPRVQQEQLGQPEPLALPELPALPEPQALPDLPEPQALPVIRGQKDLPELSALPGLPAPLALPDLLEPTGATGDTGAEGPVGPTGETGPTGAAATITIGSVTTGDPGTEASVTNSGTSEDAVFDFVIPRGEPGGGGAPEVLATVDTTPQPTLANGALIFNETPLVSGTAITHTAGSPDVQINQPGIYQAFFTGTVLIDAGTTIPSTLTVQLTLNGVPITGAVARHTFTASNEEVTLSMNAPFPVTGAGTLEVVTSDAGYTFEDASLTVVRLGDSTNFRTAV